MGYDVSSAVLGYVVYPIAPSLRPAFVLLLPPQSGCVFLRVIFYCLGYMWPKFQKLASFSLPTTLVSLEHFAFMEDFWV